MRELLMALSFTVVNLAITKIIYNNFMGDIKIDKPFMVALIGNFIGTLLGGSAINLALSIMNIALAILVNQLLGERNK